MGLPGLRSTAIAALACATLACSARLDAQQPIRRQITRPEIEYPMLPARLDPAAEQCLANIPEFMFRETELALVLSLDQWERRDGAAARVLSQLAERIEQAVVAEARAAGRTGNTLLPIDSSFAWRSLAGWFGLELSNDGQFTLIPIDAPFATELPSDAAYGLVAEVLARVREAPPVTWRARNGADTLWIHVELSTHQTTRAHNVYEHRIPIRTARVPVRTGWALREAGMYMARIDGLPAGFRGTVYLSVLVDTTGVPVADSIRVLGVTNTRVYDDTTALPELARQAVMSAKTFVYRPERIGNCLFPMRVTSVLTREVGR